jgi:fructokinase
MMFLVAGESLIDLVAEPDGNFRPVAGGAPFNYACALALQGLPTGYANAISRDRFGNLLFSALAAAGVRHVGRRTSRPTSLALVATGVAGQPEYAFYRDGVADRDFGPEGLLPDTGGPVRGYHTGGLALVPPDDTLALDALRTCRQAGAICTVDVNMRPQVAGALGVDPGRYREAALAAAAAAHVVKVSDEDLRHLGIDGPPVTAARALLDRGARLAILTLGADGAYALTREGAVFRASPRVAVVDTVGAGDTFFAGFVAWLERHGELGAAGSGRVESRVLELALRHATASAAINIGRRGCQPPTWDESLAFPLA